MMDPKPSRYRNRFANGRPVPLAGIVLGGTLWLSAQLSATAGAQCIGDCNGQGSVTVDELIVGVNVALNLVAVSACPAFDANGDGAVQIDELIAAVNNALCGCDQICPTPPPTSTRTMTATPTSVPSNTSTPSPTNSPTQPPPTPTRPPTETPTRSPTPSPTQRIGSCVSVRTGTWCLDFVDTFFEAEGVMEQSGCTLTFDRELVGQISGNVWELSASDPNTDIALTCVFSGNPATSCSGSTTVNGVTSGLKGTFGPCPE